MEGSLHRRNDEGGEGYAIQARVHGVGRGSDAHRRCRNFSRSDHRKRRRSRGGHSIRGSPQASTIAVIGDIPYGTTKLAQFPANIAQINADPDVSLVAHVGDIKNGSSLCTDDYFTTIRSDFDQFQKPLVYTPGDNEWTDCHQANNGGYLPTARLAKLRADFFPAPARRSASTHGGC